MNHNRQLGRGAWYDVAAPNFKKLKRFFRHETANKIRRQIAAENVATNLMPDSWADIARENERKKRIAKIHESFERTKNMAAMPNGTR